MRFLPVGQLGRWMAERRGIWQMPILDQYGFASFSKDRGLSFSFGSDIQELWGIGLLKADLVQADCELGVPGLELVGTAQEGNYVYSDNREELPPNGLSDSLQSVPNLPCEVKLYFHPFRYFVLYQVETILKPSIHPKQQLLHSPGYQTLLVRWQRRFDERTRGISFRDALQDWESATELAIATEPYPYSRLFSTIRQPVEVDDEAQLSAIEGYWKLLRPLYERVGQEEIEKTRRNLCITAEILDPNKTVHNILRLMSGESRINNIKGRLGGSLLLLTMAEMLRRAEEEVFGIALPEEDELGFGVVFRDARRELYGSERLFDGDRKVADEFLRLHGLDYGIRVRWYFEGETEYYAIESVLGDVSTVQLINLRGRVAERGEVAFRDSLRSDVAAGVFSWISIDGDRQDFVRAVRKAAEDDQICGMFYVAAPDFEFANFTLAELEEILWEIALENGVDASKRIILHDTIQGVKSAKALFTSAQRSLPELSEVGKGAEWGRRLMKYAVEHPEPPFLAPTARQSRQVLDALQWAIHATSANYKLSRETLRVDPKTGQGVSR